MPDTNELPPYDRDAIFNENGPFPPGFVSEAIRTLMRTLPIDPAEPPAWSARRMDAALTALAATHPRDEIELMLAVQAMSAYHAAAACWHIGMNHHRPCGDSTRHITTAATAARTFDTMLRAIERRQAKPLAVPPGRPPAQEWEQPASALRIRGWEERCLQGKHDPALHAPTAEPVPETVWTEEEIAHTQEFMEQARIEKENEGLDIANTEGILPGGGMILMDKPTPEQAAYMGRRLTLMYKREYEADLRKGIKKIPKIRGIRPGDLIP